jgi:hypothetical protein
MQGESLGITGHLLIAAFSAVLSGGLGYYLGKTKERKHFLYERRAEAVAEIRTKIRDVQQDSLV